MAAIKSLAPIILASSSLTRKAMLDRVFIDFAALSPSADEDKLKQIWSDLDVYELGLKLAQEKALSISEQYPEAYIIGADQICKLDDMVFDKPGNVEKAFAQLRTLAGKTHEQICSCSIIHQNKVIWNFQESAFLEMRNLNDEEIKSYIELEKPFAACGSFMLEKHGKHLFKKIKGDQDVILGLPVIELLDFLYTNKILVLDI